MADWKTNFTEKLKDVQGRWLRQFDEVLDNRVTPVFDDVAQFVRNHGFATSVPMKDDGRRSFKFELAENAYLLLIVKAEGVGEFVLSRESFVPGREPLQHEQADRLADVTETWARQQFEEALDEFVDHLSSATADAAEPELEAVAV
jgi:hypothetical protein